MTTTDPPHPAIQDAAIQDAAMLKKMIVHTLLAAAIVGTLATGWQAAAQGTGSLRDLWTVARHDD